METGAEQSPDIEMEAYRSFAKEMAARASEIMKRNFTLGMKKEWKSDESPVTASDTEINALLLSEVKTRFPDHSVYGEESSEFREGAEYIWVCDPVDGTTPFSAGVPLSTFSLALVKDGHPIVGIICDPFGDRTFYAEKERGATLNGNEIHVSDAETLDRGLVDLENCRGVKYHAWELERELEEAGAKATKFWAIIYPSALVASGEFRATILLHEAAYDLAAIKVIVEQAGGKVTDLYGNEQRYDQPIKGGIISNGKVHDQLVTMIRKYLPEE